MGSIPFDVKEDVVRAMFANVGPIKTFRLIRDGNGVSKGFAFCEFRDEEHAVAALNSMDGMQLGDRRLKVDTTSKDGAGDDGDGAYAARVSPETKREIENALKKLSMSEIYDVVSEMKILIQRDRDHAFNLLKSKPVLAQALLTAQLMLGMVHVHASASAPAPSASALAGPGRAGAASKEEEMTEEQAALMQRVLAMTQTDIDSIENEVDRQKILDIRAQIMG